MKKRNLKSLALNKKAISNFKINHIKGAGSNHTNCRWCVTNRYGSCDD
ncbi:hypothetical protein H2O64_10300 [Kordia sp. YSTF-M3]|uniref:Natural product n=1 Tax=Kordia aestuariivivens TaxID=2759037 RepID=A0ABR7Q928_9FLAO|nr:hypothetical protein [Kordia aestuariivivens]MBC8755064.1 hypothetical protein [Kordia aestuariivivens]